MADTFYPDGTDGRIRCNGGDFATARGGANATVFDVGSTTTVAPIDRAVGSDRYISRVYFIFDTTSIPSGDIVSAVTLNWYSTALPVAETIYFAKGTQHATLDAADWAAFTGGSLGHVDATSGAFSLSLTTSIVTVNGLTKIVAFDSNDWLNSETAAQTDDNTFTLSASANKPSLVVTHAPAVSFGAGIIKNMGFFM